MEQQAKKLDFGAIDSMQLYSRASAVLRRKLGIIGNVFTKEQRELYNEEQRKIWLAIFAPQKLKDEYGITLSQSYDCDAVDKIVKEIANGIVDEIINTKLLTH